MLPIVNDAILLANIIAGQLRRVYESMGNRAGRAAASRA